jgi:hypothetical protein
VSETVEIDYTRLAEALMQSESFANKVAGRIAHDTKINTGAFKTAVEQSLGDWRRDREKETKEEMDGWFFGHIKRQIEKQKANLIEKLERETQTWLDTKLDSSFKDAGRAVIERLIRDKFADVRMSFSISDLFGDRDRDY